MEPLAVYDAEGGLVAERGDPLYIAGSIGRWSEIDMTARCRTGQMIGAFDLRLSVPTRGWIPA